MTSIAARGRGRFYNVQNANQLPQIFIKEAAVILKSAIFEDTFTPRLVAPSEVVRGLSGYPALRGYVCTTPKPRAEIPIVSDKGDPILAHWQYGLGRAVAFTSDAKARWARDWLSWGQFRQFWTQIAQWALRRVENADFTTDVTVDKGEALISVEAVDEKGEYRNFLNLQTVVVSPKGEIVTLRLEQTGPGHYEAKFPTKDVGSYSLNLVELKDSPEFNAPEPNLNLLARLTEAGAGKILDANLPADPANNPFLHDRHKTFQPRDWWELLLQLAILCFIIDVGVRRIQIEREQWQKAMARVQQTVLFWKRVPRATPADESLAALLARRDQVRTTQTGPAPDARPDLFKPQQPVILPTRPEPAQSTKTGEPAAPETPSAPSGDAPSTSTTGRLLEAKRRAQRKQD
jgi:hypothetical protein